MNNHHKYNIIIMKNLRVVIVLFFCISIQLSYAQNTADDIVNKLNEFIKSKEYESAIKYIDNTLPLCDVNDYKHNLLLQYKSVILFENIKKTDEAILTAKFAIEQYERYGSNADVFNTLYKNYLIFVGTKHLDSQDENFYYKCVVGLFKKGKGTFNDTEYYDRALKRKYNIDDTDEKCMKVLQSEELYIKSQGITILELGIKYMKAQYYTRTRLFSSPMYSKPIGSQRKAIPLFKEIVEILKEYREPPHMLVAAYKELSDIYEETEQNHLIADTHKNIYELVSQNWQR